MFQEWMRFLCDFQQFSKLRFRQDWNSLANAVSRESTTYSLVIGYILRYDNQDIRRIYGIIDTVVVLLFPSDRSLRKRAVQRESRISFGTVIGC